MTNIYNLPQEVEQALDRFNALFDQDTGELIGTEEELTEAQNVLEELQNRSNEIMEWYLKARANSLAQIAGVKAEMERLSKIITREQKQVDRIENLVERIFFRIFDGKPVTFGNFTLSFRKSEGTIIRDETQIPEEFKEIVENTRIDRTKIKEAIKSGQIVPGAEIEVRQNLQIK